MQKKYGLSLLIVGGVCLVSALIMNVSIKEKPIKVQGNQLEEDIQPQFQAEKLAATANIGVLTDQVHPLQQTKRVVASGVHEAEFRGTKFIQANAKASTIELMSFGKEEVIRDFLKQRKDRKNFIYFRLVDEDEPDRYILAYGIYKNEAAAQFSLEHLHLGLPASVKPHVQNIAEYVSNVNDLGSEEMDANPLYEVKLKRATIPRPQPVVIPPAEVTKPTPNAEAISTQDAAEIMN